jgi:hypothetical protein
MKYLLLIIISLLISGNVAAAELLPIDEAYKDPSFFNFRQQLLISISNKDKSFLLTILSPTILNSYGGNGGPREFIEKWGLVNAPTSPVWNELQWILNHGGSYSIGIFCAPYVYSAWPHKYDPFEYYVAVIRKGVPLRSLPVQDSKVIKKLDYSIVKVLDHRYWDKGKDELIHVQHENLEGYVSHFELRSPTDYRACFEKLNGKWFLTSLVAGD